MTTQTAHVAAKVGLIGLVLGCALWRLAQIYVNPADRIRLRFWFGCLVLLAMACFATAVVATVVAIWTF